jgi:hypothetical protein
LSSSLVRRSLSTKLILADLDPFLSRRTLLPLPSRPTGANFRSRATTYLTNALSKGIPSVFADIKSLYTDKEKCQIIGELVEAFRKGLEEKGNFGVEGSDGDGELLCPRSSSVFGANQSLSEQS